MFIVSSLGNLWPSENLLAIALKLKVSRWGHSSVNKNRYKNVVVDFLLEPQ